MSLRKAAGIARAATKTQLSSDEDEGSDGWEGDGGSKLKAKARASARGRTSGDGVGRKKRARPRALSVDPSGTRPDSPRPPPKARKSLDSPRKVKGIKRTHESTPSGLDSDLSELSSIEDPDSPAEHQPAPTPSQSVPERTKNPPPSTVQNVLKHRPPISSSTPFRSLLSSSSFTLGVTPKTPADTSRVRNILSGVLGSSKSALGRTNSSPNISLSPLTVSFPRETWNIAKLGSCVWVLIARSGHPVRKQGEGEAYWWPAEVISLTTNETILPKQGIYLDHIPAWWDSHRAQVLRTYMRDCSTKMQLMDPFWRCYLANASSLWRDAIHLDELHPSRWLCGPRLFSSCETATD